MWRYLEIWNQLTVLLGHEMNVNKPQLTKILLHTGEWQSDSLGRGWLALVADVKVRHLLKSDVSDQKEQEQLAVYDGHFGSMTTGRPSVNRTHCYTSDNMAKRWWPHRPLCVASPRQPPSTRHRETDDRTVSVLSACLTSKSKCSCGRHGKA
jgi:hypothetical protein